MEKEGIYCNVIVRENKMNLTKSPHILNQIVKITWYTDVLFWNDNAK